MLVANITVPGTVARVRLAQQLAVTLELGLSVPVFMATLLCGEAHSADSFVVGFAASFDVDEFHRYRETVNEASRNGELAARHADGLRGLASLLDEISDAVARVVEAGR